MATTEESQPVRRGGDRTFGRGREGGAPTGDRAARGRDGAAGGRGGPAGRGGKRGGPGGRGRGAPDWEPLTKLGRLVKAGKVTSFEQIFQMSLPIKENEIVKRIADAKESETETKFAEEVMKVKPVQKQTKAGQRTRFKAWVLIGDRKGHLGLGQKSHKEVQIAIKGAIQDAKLKLIPVRFGYWGNKIGLPHTIPFKITGKNGSVSIRLTPAPRGTGIVGAPTSKKVLQMAGVQDCYTSSIGCTKTKGNFLFATFNALKQTYTYLTPEFWGAPRIERGPLDAHEVEKEKKQY